MHISDQLISRGFLENYSFGWWKLQHIWKHAMEKFVKISFLLSVDDVSTRPDCDYDERRSLLLIEQSTFFDWLESL